MKIAKDVFAVIEYDLRLEDGSYVKGENGLASMNFIAGYGEILPSLEQRLLGLQEGSEAEFTIPAKEAFGERDQSQVKTMSFTDFPAGVQLEAGKWAVATNEETKTQYGYFVREKTSSTITIDYNHPLAGKDLLYRVRVVHVRPALKEELEHLRPCEHGNAPSLDD